MVPDDTIYLIVDIPVDIAALANFVYALAPFCILRLFSPSSATSLSFHFLSGRLMFAFSSRNRAFPLPDLSVSHSGLSPSSGHCHRGKYVLVGAV